MSHYFMVHSKMSILYLLKAFMDIGPHMHDIHRCNVPMITFVKDCQQVMRFTSKKLVSIILIIRSGNRSIHTLFHYVQNT